MDNLKEMDGFLETYNLPRMNPDQTASKEIESVIKHLPTQMVSLVNSTKYLNMN